MDLGENSAVPYTLQVTLTGSTLNGYLQGANGMKGEKGDSGLPGPQGPSVSPWRLNVHSSRKTLKWASYSPTQPCQMAYQQQKDHDPLGLSSYTRNICQPCTGRRLKCLRGLSRKQFFRELSNPGGENQWFSHDACGSSSVHVEPMFFLVFSPELSEIFESLIVVVALQHFW